MELLREVDPARAICFSGHRPDRLPGKGEAEAPDMQPLTAALRQALIAAVGRGKTTMLHGCMAGWDIICAEQVLWLKRQCPQVRLISVAPYHAGFFSREDCWTPDWIGRAREVFCQHDTGIKIAGHYRPGIYYERNRALVDHASELICYWDGGSGGTEYTVERAKENALPIYNLCTKQKKSRRT
ncbi:MAG: SLOG family protein [Firmicutes bacterium]|nr:SLOG family protein [Bacillota bacterium]